MPDVLHWLGVTRIDRLMSMSNMKYDAITGSGIEVGERVPIPADLIPPDASVEMEAKKAAGYYTPDGAPDAETLAGVKGTGPGEVLRPGRNPYSGFIPGRRRRKPPQWKGIQRKR
jgi:hypothetical protein